MRVAICYSSSPIKMETLAKGLSSGLENNGHKVDIIPVDKSTNPLNVGIYDLVIVGSSSVGFFGGKISDDIDAFLAKMTRMEGRKAAAFVMAGGFGSGKSLTALMKAAERQGAIVIDFATLTNEKEARRFGAKFK